MFLVILTNMWQYAFSIGSNLGNRSENLKRAVSELSAYGEIQAVSGVYDNPAVGFNSGNRFYNQCLVLVSKTQRNWKEIIPRIEKSMGRISAEGYADRLIDIDLLLVLPENGEVGGLTVPHPRMSTRHFVLLPLFDIRHVLESDTWIKKIEEWGTVLPHNPDIYCIDKV